MKDTNPVEKDRANKEQQLSRARLHTPFYLFIITIVSIFMAEAIVMLVLSVLPPLSVFSEALIDSTLLVVIVFPVLYFLLLRPLRVLFRNQEKLILELQEALANVRTLRGLLPICAWCKKVRDDKGYWKEVEEYVRDKTDASFTHGMCPDCYVKVVKEIKQPKN
jgi:preprotein translocase subunit YajC